MSASLETQQQCNCGRHWTVCSGRTPACLAPPAPRVCAVCGSTEDDVFPCDGCGVRFCFNHGLEHAEAPCPGVSR